MSDAELKTEVRKGIIANFVFNVAINGGLTLWLMGGNETLAMWSDPAFGPDLLITGFLLSAIVAAIGLEVHRRKARRGDMAPVPLEGSRLQFLTGRNRWSTCTIFGLAGTALSAVILLGVGLAATSLSLNEYAMVKGLWAGVLAALIVYPSTVLGLHLGATQVAKA